WDERAVVADHADVERRDVVRDLGERIVREDQALDAIGAAIVTELVRSQRAEYDRSCRRLDAEQAGGAERLHLVAGALIVAQRGHAADLGARVERVEASTQPVGELHGRLARIAPT